MSKTFIIKKTYGFAVLALLLSVVFFSSASLVSAAPPLRYGPLIGATSGNTSSPLPQGTTETWYGTRYQEMGAADKDHTVFIGIKAGYDALTSLKSVFIGNLTGYEADGSYLSHFIGNEAGYQAEGAYWATFIGDEAGYQANQANHSNFIGKESGYQAVGSNNSVFIGAGSGYQADHAVQTIAIGGAAGAFSSNAIKSIFLGHYAGRNTNATRSIFLGEEAGHGATKASYSIFIGDNAGKNDLVDNSLQGLNRSSILIGNNTSTGGNPDSIALGAGATNTTSNQLMVGSNSSPVNTTQIIGAGSTQCTITTGAGLACSSDERLKTNIADLPSDVLDVITKMRSVTYNWKKGGPDADDHIGFIAQDVQKYYPELVSENTDGTLSVNYAGMTPVLVEAVRELNDKVDSLEAQVEAQQAQIDAILSAIQ